jgi:cyclophilin family peptidyl-prolyl cis-trans isomerase
VLARLQQAHPDDVRIVYRHCPLRDIHDKAQLAAEAAEAAGAQGKFWEMHDLLFERRAEWVDQSAADFRTTLDAYATELELDAQRFAVDLDSGAFRAKVDAAYDSATTLGGQGLPGTPFVLFNDQPLEQGVIPFQFWAFDMLVKLETLKDRQYVTPEEIIDPFKKYTATLETEQGDIVIELYAEQTPLTVNSFVFLAREGWFDDITFHRVISGFVAQTGDPTGTGLGGPGYYIPNEIVPEFKYDAAGVVGMANAGPDTNGSQFFITMAPAPELDGQYTIFGKVIAGMEVVRALTLRNPQQDPEAPAGDKLITVTIEEK